VGVLSGNRNFEGRIHPSTRASYLASPPLVIAYAIAGRINIDFETEPLGFRPISNKPIYLKDIWPKRKELQEIETYWVLPQIYYKLLDKISVNISYI
jgi:aconitate hydratase